MPAKIIDEFSELPISRQRKHLLRKAKLGLCNYGGCKNKRVDGYVNCKIHTQITRELSHKAKGCKTRYLNCESYKIEYV